MSPNTGSCPLCTTQQQSTAQYFERAFNNPANRQSTVDALVDGLGLCVRHGALLGAQDLPVQRLSRIFQEAVKRMGVVLQDDCIRWESVEQSLFAAHKACPACRYEEYAVTRHASQLSRLYANETVPLMDSHLNALCNAHLQRTVRDWSNEARLKAIAQRLERLEATARTIEHTETASLFVLVAGAAQPGWLAACDAAQTLHGVEQTSHTLAEYIGATDICPLCVAEHRSRERWLHNLRLATVHPHDRWLFFPTCAEHLWAVAESADVQTLAAATGHALEKAIGQLRDEAHELQHSIEVAEARRLARAAKQAGWRATKLAVEKPLETHDEIKTRQPPAPCQACEYLDIARDSAIGHLLNLLENKAHCGAFAHGYGLCMKHFSQTYIVAPAGPVRTLLRDTQRERLIQLEHQFLHNDDRGKAYSNHSRESLWRAALHRFCGFV